VFKKSKVFIEEEGAEDENSEIKFNIKDPDTKIRKTVSFGAQENFTPRLVFNDDEVLDENQQIDVEKLKAICMEYIVYEDNQLI
jgi:ribosome-binding factor A